MSTEPNTSELISSHNIKALVLKNWTSVIWVSSEYPPDTEDMAKATTLICMGDDDFTNSVISNPSIPPYIPILVVSRQGGPFQLLMPPENRLVDFLELPTSHAMLAAKVNFLKRVYTLASVQNNHFTSHAKQLDVLSNYDGLTGLRNRQQFTKDLAQEMELAQKDGIELTLMVFNIDLFNEINKKYGLDYGDLILNEMAARATEIVKRPSKCYRYSTEDFVALLPGLDLNQTINTAERLRQACMHKAFGSTTYNIPVTISIGLASFSHHHPEDHEKFIFMAETALFRAKAAGRNRVETFDSPDVSEDTGPPNALLLMKDKLSRILDKTRVSTIASLQHLAKSLTGPEHQNHADRVLTYTNLLGKKLRLPEKIKRSFLNSITIYTSFRFLLHDDLLSKPGKLTKDEWSIIEDLPYKLRELTEIFDYFRDERIMLLCQSENYDGSGYPEGKKGEEIPLGSRILKIVDALAAMNGERPYRKSLTPEEIINELYDGAGKQFDPILVLHLLQAIEENGLLKISANHLEEVQKNLSANLENLRI